MSRERVLVGMSGGIDSSAVCLMLQEAGYEVVGLTMRVWDLVRQFSSEQQELPDFIISAKQLAERLGMEHYVADERESFKDVVVKDFLDEYCGGRTPNPCVLCNKKFKFRVLTEWADKLNCKYISTGHYVRLEDAADGTRHLLCGVDKRKDQSYFLWRLSQDVLKRCIFPLGTKQKTDVRDYLDSKGFAVKAKSTESMEICFVEGNYRDFLRQQYPQLEEKVAGGYFVDSKGKRIGNHCGVPFFTVGQRKGLGIALGRPVYVLKLNAEKNTVMLGDEPELLTKCMLVEDLRIDDVTEPFGVRIRYHSQTHPCTLTKVSDTQYLVRFEEPVYAVTPGQSAVFYIGERMIGGSIISSQKGIGMYL